MGGNLYGSPLGVPNTLPAVHLLLATYCVYGSDEQCFPQLSQVQVAIHTKGCTYGVSQHVGH